MTRILSLCGLLFGSLLPTATARAEEPIQVVVLAITANSKSKEIDASIKEIAAEVRKKEKDLTKFQLHSSARVSIAQGKSATVQLVEKAEVEITVNAKTDDQGRITLTIKPPKLDEIRYACKCDRYFPVITNYYTKDGDRLIIAVMARPCQGKK